MDTIVRKMQPLDSPCPICGQRISWHACEKCNQTGRLEECPGGFHCDEWRTGRYCNWCGKPLPVDRNTCNDCGGKGWIRDSHLCDPAASGSSSASPGARRHTDSQRATGTKKSTNTGQQTRQGGSDSAWSVILLLILIILALIFIPELGEMLRGVLK